jgi:hypothetical protein
MLTLINSARYLGADEGYTFSAPISQSDVPNGNGAEKRRAFRMTAGFLLVKVIE